MLCKKWSDNIDHDAAVMLQSFSTFWNIQVKVCRESRQTLLRQAAHMASWLEDGRVGDGVDGKILPFGDHKITEKSLEERVEGGGREAGARG